MQSEIRPYVRDLLSRLGADIVFVDAGSRNGILELADLADWVDAYGFEPNPAEYEKLVSGQTDAARFGIVSPHYRSLSYASYALFDHSGRHDFFVTRGPGACGLLEPDWERLSEIHWKGRKFERSFAADVFEVLEVQQVEVRRLDEFAQERGLSTIDYLKIDVEGAEYEVLQGAGSLLPQVGVIKVEVCFIPFRRKQKLFSEVDLLLRPFGFDLLRFEIDPVQVGYKERERPVDFWPSLGIADRRGQALSCDAIYVNRGLDERRRLVVQAAVLIDKGYLDEALFILKSRARLGPEEAGELLERLRTLERRAWVGRAYTWLVRARAALHV